MSNPIATAIANLIADGLVEAHISETCEICDKPGDIESTRYGRVHPKCAPKSRRNKR